MKILHLSSRFVLCMSLFVSVAKAENISVPDKENRQGMSYEEYSNYREKMRMHMERMTPEERKQAQDLSGRPPERMEKPNHDSAYGQGYHSRDRAESRPDMGAGNRPDHPRIERFNRGDMGRR